VIDLKRIEYLCSGGFDGSELQDEAPELVTWVREVLPLLEGEVELHEMRDEDELAAELRKHVEKVKL